MNLLGLRYLLYCVCLLGLIIPSGYCDDGNSVSGQLLERRLDAIILKEVRFKDASLDEVVAWLNKENRRVAPHGMGFTIKIGTDKTSIESKKVLSSLKLTLKMDNAKLWNVIRAIGLELMIRQEISEDTIAFVPLSSPR